MDDFVRKIVDRLQLSPLGGEGGLFRETYKSSQRISLAGYAGERPLGTAIYFLLTDDVDSFSALHRLPGDEIYHFYLGDAVALYLIFPEGASRRVLLGSDVLS